ncbi:2-keto-4-pentenoate hydratase [Kribbella antibiotica]|uniref:2-keto-4-pentenoate hydratase n=1 Tax=Kribbella antibiotica TaxID=190195 RepID=A0A4R4ZRL5_9ACTN|nr:fumarylacetoacetate hydrolase family protein [Kribbella antibiotica]TDD61668.1 2-keto-4-pentenoate hydratase [Kribbella antibiotica]
MTSPTASTLDEAVARLAAAAGTGVGCAPVRELIGADITAAYAVQQKGITARVNGGATLLGRKIGLTSEAVQRQLGVDQPDFGVLLSDMAYADAAELPVNRLLEPRVEAEIAFVLKADLAVGPFDADLVAGAVDYAVAALEIVDSRIAGWDITYADTIADNASAALYVLGRDRAGLDGFVPRVATMSMSLNGAVVSTGTGAASLGDPLAALAWLAMIALAMGAPLRAGEVVLSGALGPVVPIGAGDSVTATISGLGSVQASFVLAPE